MCENRIWFFYSQLLLIILYSKDVLIIQFIQHNTVRSELPYTRYVNNKRAITIIT